MSFAIAAGNQETLESAKIILENGGNAVDAAISAFLTSMISEPCMSSPGGGGLALVKTTDNQVKSFDFFCETPKTKIERNREEFFPITVDFGGVMEDFYIGAGSMATPGSIAGVYALHRSYGSIPLRDLFSHAIEKSKNGVIVDTFQAYDILLLKDILTNTKNGRDRFLKNGKLVEEGDRVELPDLSDFFDVLSREGESFFYNGDISAIADRYSRDHGGHLSRSDFEEYRVNISEPFRFKSGNKEILTAHYPSKGGPIMAVFNHYLEKLNALRPFSSSHLKGLAYALTKTKKIISDRSELKTFISSHFGIDFAFRPEIKKGGTMHFSIMDDRGMAVALTTSIGEGSGVWLDSTDIHMNNMLGEEALMDNGFYNWEPDIRLMSMMTPTIAHSLDSDRTLITGTGGAGRIPYMLAELVHYVFDLDMDLEQASTSPRVYLRDGALQVEPGFNTHGTENCNEWDKLSLYFGGPNSILLNQGHVVASGDPRRYGVSYYC